VTPNPDGRDFSGNNFFGAGFVSKMALLLVSSMALQIYVDFILSLLSLTKTKNQPLQKSSKNSTTKKVIPVLKNCK